MICADCDASYEVKGKFVPTFCNNCIVDRKKDIVEIITPNGCTRYQNVLDAEEALGNFTANVRLDLHNVLDLIGVGEELKYNIEDCCCISFVGQITPIRVQARNEIIERIKSGQIAFGALVFKRGNRRKPVEGHTFTEVGSKAWFNKHVKATWDNCIFADDSTDHVDSVKHAMPQFDCILVNNEIHCRQLFI